MINRPTAAGIFVDDRECRTRHRRRTSHTGSETFHELRLAAPELAFERENAASAEILCEVTAKLLGLSRAI